MPRTIPAGIGKRNTERLSEYRQGVYPQVAAGLNGAMGEEKTDGEPTVVELRRISLELLRQRARGAKAASLARAIDRSPALVNNYLSGVKRMGEGFARHVETALGLQPGWMDRKHEPEELLTDGNSGLAVIREEPAEFPVRGGAASIDRLDVVASMGSGADLPERESVIDSIRVPMEWVRENFPHVTSPKNLKIITGYGDSMHPTFRHGDPLIIDVGVSAMDIDTVYVFAFENELYIKRIQRLPDKSIKVISDNRAMYDPFVLDAKQREDVHVIGRVICAVNMNKIS